MAARQRKTLIVCHVCHMDIQHGHPRRRTSEGVGHGRKDRPPVRSPDFGLLVRGLAPDAKVPTGRDQTRSDPA
jgi:hypothetical protein